MKILNPRTLKQTSNLKKITNNRFDPDLIDKYGNSLIENEFYVNKVILRPTRKTRDNIEILSSIKYREPPRRYTGELKCFFTSKRVYKRNEDPKFSTWNKITIATEIFPKQQHKPSHTSSLIKICSLLCYLNVINPFPKRKNNSRTLFQTLDRFICYLSVVFDEWARN